MDWDFLLLVSTIGRDLVVIIFSHLTVLVCVEDMLGKGLISLVAGEVDLRQLRLCVISSDVFLKEIALLEVVCCWNVYGGGARCVATIVYLVLVVLVDAVLGWELSLVCF